jgi:CorA-like Mg2+ transporter protein
MAITGTDSTGTVSALRCAAAIRVADELRLDPSSHRTAKVSSLLHTFRGPGDHCDIADMMDALRAQEVTARAGNPEVSRRDVLEFCLSEEAAARTTQSRVDPGIRVSHWRPGEVGRARPLEDAGDPINDATNVVRWFDVDARGSEPSLDAVPEVSEKLQPWCPELNPMIVRDLLTPDAQPKSEIYGDERTGVRTVSVPALVAREIPDDDDEFDGLDEQLIVQIVELVVGPNWIITCWHPSRTLLGEGVVEEGPPLLREPFLNHVGHRWMHDAADAAEPETAKDAGDLAVYLARSLVGTFGASLRMLQRWVSTWEVEFYKALGGHDSAGRGQRTSLKDAAVEISNFLAVVGEFSRSVNAFKLAGDEMPNDTWFADPATPPRADGAERIRGEQAKALGSSVEAAATKLGQLYTEIRADMELLMIQSQARQQESSERLQGYLSKITGLILVPTFVAGLFGANTALPGQGNWVGFELMLVLMALSAATSYWVIRKLIA